MDQRRRAVTRLLGGEASPDLLAAQFVVANHRRAVATGEADQMPAAHERVGGKAPDRCLDTVLRLEILLPKHLAGVGVEAEEVALCAERVNAIAIHRWRRAWPGRITDRVAAVVLVHPELAAGFFVETNHPFRAGNVPPGKLIVRVGGIFGQLAVGHINLPLGYGRSGVAAADGHPPINLRPAIRKFFEDATLTPDPVALGPEPLRPVICQRRQAKRLAKRQAE